MPEEYGGHGADMVSFALVFEEISRGWMGIAGILGSHSLACAMIARHGTEEQKRRYLPDLATGARRTGIALTEPDAGTDLQGITTTRGATATTTSSAAPRPGSPTPGTPTRCPCWCKTDPDADARPPGDVGAARRRRAPGFEVTRDLPKLGYKGTESCEVVLDDVRVPVDAACSAASRGAGCSRCSRRWRPAASTSPPARVGVAQRALRRGAGLRQRAPRVRPADRGLPGHAAPAGGHGDEVQAARLMTYWAASQADRGERVDLETGWPRCSPPRSALQAALDAMRVHGGYGYSTEFEVERLYRDAPLMTIGEGTNDMLRTVIAKSLIKGDARVA